MHKLLDDYQLLLLVKHQSIQFQDAINESLCDFLLLSGAENEGLFENSLDTGNDSLNGVISLSLLNSDGALESVEFSLLSIELFHDVNEVIGKHFGDLYNKILLLVELLLGIKVDVEHDEADISAQVSAALRDFQQSVEMGKGQAGLAAVLGHVVLILGDDAENVEENAEIGKFQGVLYALLSCLDLEVEIPDEVFEMRLALWGVVGDQHIGVMLVSKFCVDNVLVQFEDAVLPEFGHHLQALQIRDLIDQSEGNRLYRLHYCLYCQCHQLLILQDFLVVRKEVLQQQRHVDFRHQASVHQEDLLQVILDQLLVLLVEGNEPGQHVIALFQDLQMQIGLFHPAPNFPFRTIQLDVNS